MRAGGLSLPLTPVADTGRGGRHVFTRPIGVTGTRRLFLGGTHIGELKSRGGLVLVCPSVTERPYSWRYAPAELTPAVAPDWLRALVERPVPPPHRVPWPQVSIAPRADLVPLTRHVERTAPGNRNAALYWAAHRAAEAGIPEGIATAGLVRAYVAAGSEPGADREREGRATIASAYR
jgi:hypothetical protein